MENPMSCSSACRKSLCGSRAMLVLGFSSGVGSGSRKNGSFLPALAACLLFGAAAPAQDAGFTTTWSKAGDLAGFESPQGKLVQVADGGNPSGFLKTVKTTSILPKPYLRTNLGK